MPEYVGALIELGLTLFCLIECIQTPGDRVRNLPTWAWILLILVVPYVGSIAWLVAGRPTAASARRSVPWPSTETAGFPEYERPITPDDDPAFLARLAASESGDRRLFAQWEADLRAREARLRDTERAPAEGADDPEKPGTP